MECMSALFELFEITTDGSMTDTFPSSFVATVLHPVFMTSGASRNVDLRYDGETGDLEVVRTKVIKNYLHVPPYKGIAIPGQPKRQVSC